MKSTIKLILIFCITAIISSCAGGRIAIQAPNLEYPVSTTSNLYDKDFNILDNANYQVLNSKSTTNEEYNYLKVEFDENGEFIYRETRWSILWTIIGFSSYNKDVSAPLNKIIEKYNADAIINFKIAPTSSGLLNFFGTYIPIIPTYITAEMKGKLVKLKK